MSNGRRDICDSISDWNVSHQICLRVRVYGDGECNLFLLISVLCVFSLFIPFYNWCADLRYICTCCQRSLSTARSHTHKTLNQIWSKKGRNAFKLNDQQIIIIILCCRNGILIASSLGIFMAARCEARCVRAIFYKLEAFWKWHNSCTDCCRTFNITYFRRGPMGSINCFRARNFRRRCWNAQGTADSFQFSQHVHRPHVPPYDFPYFFLFMHGLMKSVAWAWPSKAAIPKFFPKTKETTKLHQFKFRISYGRQCVRILGHSWAYIT